MAIDSESLLINHFGHLPGFRKIGKEWHSACPNCGGDGKSDRFFMNVPDNVMDIVRGVCRQCNYFEPVLDSDQVRHVDSKTKEEWAAERRKRRELEKIELAKKIEDLTNSGIAREYHDHMTFGQRAEWYRQGILDPTIERFSLGYTEARSFGGSDNPVITDALTIPFWEGKFDLVTNIQFRLQHYPEGFGKYRPLYGFKMSLFKTIPDEPLTGSIIVCEGAKKAMVVAQNLWKEGAMTNVVAVPSKMPPEDLLLELSEAEVVFVMLDPDAYETTTNKNGTVGGASIDRTARILYNSNPEQSIRLVRLPVKADDFFSVYGHDVDLLRRYFINSMRVTYERQPREYLFRRNT